MADYLEDLYRAYPLYRELFTEQLEFILCPSRFIAALCGRRAGKTTVSVIKCVTQLISEPNGLGLYLGLTNDSVRDIVRPIIRPMLRKYKIPHEIQKNRVIFGNGSELALLGANDIDKIESFRGTKLTLCIVDECASFKNRIFESLIEEVLRPALVDLQGQLILIGTPANKCSGLFYNATMGIDTLWEVKKWLGFDNPHTKQQLLSESSMYKDKQTPKYRREFLAEWCTDADQLLLKEPTIVDVMPYSSDTCRSVIGVDFGFNDETVFSVLVWRNNNKTTCVYESFGESGLNVTQIANKLKQLRDKYKPILIVADPAGSGKILMEEFITKHGMYIQPSQKHNKADYIEILNDAIVNQRLLINRLSTEKLQQQIKKVNWNKERTRENEGQECDHIDALLYAFRESLAYTEQIIEHKVKTQAELEQELYESQLLNHRKRLGSYKDEHFEEVAQIVQESNFIDSLFN